MATTNWYILCALPSIDLQTGIRFWEKVTSLHHTRFWRPHYDCFWKKCESLFGRLALLFVEYWTWSWRGFSTLIQLRRLAVSAAQDFHDHTITACLEGLPCSWRNVGHGAEEKDSALIFNSEGLHNVFTQQSSKKEAPLTYKKIRLSSLHYIS